MKQPRNFCEAINLLQDADANIQALHRQLADAQQLGAGIEAERDILMENAICAEPWQIKAADWLEQVVKIQDAEGLTAPEEIEIAGKLAEVLRTEAKHNVKEHEDDNDKPRR